MDLTLEIKLTSGKVIRLEEGEWDTYSYDKKAIIVKKNNLMIGAYNWDHVVYAVLPVCAPTKPVFTS